MNTFETKLAGLSEEARGCGAGKRLAGIDEHIARSR